MMLNFNEIQEKIYEYGSIINAPKDVLKRMNEIFLDVMQGNNYFTAFIGKLEKSVLTVSNAGHPYPFYYSQIMS